MEAAPSCINLEREIHSSGSALGDHPLAISDGGGDNASGSGSPKDASPDAPVVGMPHATNQGLVDRPPDAAPVPAGEWGTRAIQVTT